MLLTDDIAYGVADGRITLIFRRWSQPRITAGSTQLTQAGLVVVDDITEVDDPGRLTEADAYAAGHPDLGRLLHFVRGRGEGRLYRIAVHHGGPDPRIALRETQPTEDELIQLREQLQRLDSRRSGSWTTEVLRWIADHPAVVARELATDLGRELAGVKADVRKLKALGLTESLEVGYRLSPRGLAYLNSRGQIADEDRGAGEDLPALG